MCPLPTEEGSEHKKYNDRLKEHSDKPKIGTEFIVQGATLSCCSFIVPAMVNDSRSLTPSSVLWRRNDSSQQCYFCFEEGGDFQCGEAILSGICGDPAYLMELKRIHRHTRNAELRSHIEFVACSDLLSVHRTLYQKHL
ncbi:hypothetical protein Y032_0102g3460 [Ancylostoma ceylanicum]|uniref:Uncharacterized protein n=1 Tax=Ancylostoma ceylanicum TaxID=53326 RepID=A0A016THF5_9BILA|nr:hypothetical protein Y032_0102g3460 [Ancylostoma ceylanicum]